MTMWAKETLNERSPHQPIRESVRESIQREEQERENQTSMSEEEQQRAS